jgi:hypothetical protein
MILSKTNSSATANEKAGTDIFSSRNNNRFENSGTIPDK